MVSVNMGFRVSKFEDFRVEFSRFKSGWPDSFWNPETLKP
jgi:hypothetical protein